jgi:hypothetical protein
MRAPRPPEIHEDVWARQESAAYAKIVAECKAATREAAKTRRTTGAETDWDIKKTWHEHCGVAFDDPEPYRDPGPPLPKPVPTKRAKPRNGALPPEPTPEPQPRTRGTRPRPKRVKL